MGEFIESSKAKTSCLINSINKTLMMRKLVLITLFLAGVQFATHAQLNKAVVENMMKEVGTSIDKMESLYIGNLYVYYSNGVPTKKSERKDKSSGGFERKFEITDSGIAYKSYKGGKISSMTLFPYSSIKYVFILTNSMEIELKK